MIEKATHELILLEKLSVEPGIDRAMHVYVPNRLCDQRP